VTLTCIALVQSDSGRRGTGRYVNHDFSQEAHLSAKLIEQGYTIRCSVVSSAAVEQHLRSHDPRILQKNAAYLAAVGAMAKSLYAALRRDLSLFSSNST
jgi:hypothetical protein